jgi:Fungal N-terminal domain of STAND proteins
MAEAIGLASGLLALGSFAFQCSISLIKTIQSFQVHPKRVRDLKEELEALATVLGPLTERVAAAHEADLSALGLPLLRCGRACEEFEHEIVKCSSRSGSNRTSFRDWAKLTYMGDDIDGFRQLVAGYKSTIIIALTDANLLVFVLLYIQSG